MLSLKIWARPMAVWPAGRPFAAVMATVGIGAAMPLLGGGLPVLVLSALLFGCFFMVPATITAFVKSSMPPAIWGEVDGAPSRCSSRCSNALARRRPVILADVTGSLAAGLGVSAGILLLGAVVGLLQRPI